MNIVAGVTLVGCPLKAFVILLSGWMLYVFKGTEGVEDALFIY